MTKLESDFSNARNRINLTATPAIARRLKGMTVPERRFWLLSACDMKMKAEEREAKGGN